MKKWLAWKLVQLAARLHDAEWVEVLTAVSPSGHEIRIEVMGDEYGCGIYSTTGLRWTDQPTGIEAAACEGWRFTWTLRPKDDS